MSIRPQLGVRNISKIGFPALLLLVVPSIALAQAPTFSQLVDRLLELINLVIPILASVAVIFFLWGILRYIAAASDSENHQKGRDMIIWGTIALFVLFSVWGLVGLIQATFL